MDSDLRSAETHTVIDAALTPLEVGTFVVHVVEGPDAGASLRVDGRVPSRIFVGQGPACALRLTDPRVSRRHLAFEVVEGRLRVLDLESSNGTEVDGLRVVEAFLQGGERMRIGKSLLAVERGESATIALGTATTFGRTVGASPEMKRLYPLCKRLAASDVPVIIEGETGTGKEVLAESLHEKGPRAGAPFVVFDCTAVPANLLEAALFGHERGAFTGAVDTKKGVFEQAHGGTLFIDEIGDLDIALQAKLLRALERFEIRRVGGDRWIKVDVRVLAATRRDLDREVAAGRFRDDLFFRLAVGRIELPPLRRRQGDIGALAAHFWKHLKGPGVIPEGLVRKLESYPWPGNVRELHNAVARTIALGDLAASTIGAMRVPGSAASDDPVERVLALDLPFLQARDRMVEEFQRRYVERVLARHEGNVTRAAEASGIARRYFQTIRSKSKAPPA